MDSGAIEGSGFEVVTLLPGLTTLRKRSGEIEGNLPVRAARYCGPVFEGSEVGFQIVLAQPMTITSGRRGRISCDVTPPTLEQLTELVDGALDRGIKEGLITRGGRWHRLFKGDALPIRGQRVLLWTGHMIRPRAGIWLLVGGAFNRRSRVTVVDHLASDPDHFVPLVIEMDMRGASTAPVWLESELGCVTPFSPAVRMRKERVVAGAPELQQFGAFFSDAYFETKAQHPTATYVRRQRDNRVKAAPECAARLLYTGPDVHQIGEIDRFVTPDGFSRSPSSPGILQYGLVRNIAATSWTWQGQTHPRFDVKKERLVPALEALWRETFGDGNASGLEFLRGYMTGEMWDQPYVQLQPWVWAPTDVGWSSVVDGIHGAPAYDGMRGVIATDWFFGLAMVYRIFGPSTARIPVRAPMLRTIPVPRGTLALGMKESTL